MMIKSREDLIEIFSLLNSKFADLGVVVDELYVLARAGDILAGESEVPVSEISICLSSREAYQKIKEAWGEKGSNAYFRSEHPLYGKREFLFIPISVKGDEVNLKIHYCVLKRGCAGERIRESYTHIKSIYPFKHE